MGKLGNSKQVHNRRSRGFLTSTGIRQLFSFSHGNFHCVQFSSKLDLLDTIFNYFGRISSDWANKSINSTSPEDTDSNMSERTEPLCVTIEVLLLALFSGSTTFCRIPTKTSMIQRKSSSQALLQLRLTKNLDKNILKWLNYVLLYKIIS